MKKKYFYFIGAIIILVAVTAVVYLLTSSAGTGRKIDAQGFNLLVITLDTTRADRIGAYGHSNAQTPNLDRLAANGVMFENCYSPVPVTLPAHSSIFTGKYPLGHGARDNGTFILDKQEATLAETMKKQGYQTHAVIAAFVLLSKFGLNQGFDIYDDSLNVAKMLNNFDSEINAQQVYDKFSKWFNHIKTRQNLKFFSWLHFYDPHLPYDPPDQYKEKFGPTPGQLYDAEIAFVDDFFQLVN